MLKITKGGYDGKGEVVKLLEDSGVRRFTVYKEIYDKSQSGIRGDYESLNDISGNLEIVSITSPR